MPNDPPCPACTAAIHAFGGDHPIVKVLLLDKLNSAQLGGIKAGDQFRLTGELFMSELWMTGATGEFSVLLKAQGGAQDLSVFVDESDAAGWQEGTKVQMIVEMGEATINGETTDGSGCGPRRQPSSGR